MTWRWVSAGVWIQKEWRSMAPGREESQGSVSNNQQNDEVCRVGRSDVIERW